MRFLAALVAALALIWFTGGEASARSTYGLLACGGNAGGMAYGNVKTPALSAAGGVRFAPPCTAWIEAVHGQGTQAFGDPFDMTRPFETWAIQGAGAGGDCRWAHALAASQHGESGSGALWRAGAAALDAAMTGPSIDLVALAVTHPVQVQVRDTKSARIRGDTMVTTWDFYGTPSMWVRMNGMIPAWMLGEDVVTTRGYDLDAFDEDAAWSKEALMHVFSEDLEHDLSVAQSCSSSMIDERVSVWDEMARHDGTLAPAMWQDANARAMLKIYRRLSGKGKKKAAFDAAPADQVVHWLDAYPGWHSDHGKWMSEDDYGPFVR